MGRMVLLTIWTKLSSKCNSQEWLSAVILPVLDLTGHKPQLPVPYQWRTPLPNLERYQQLLKGICSLILRVCGWKSCACPGSIPQCWTGWARAGGIGCAWGLFLRCTLQAALTSLMVFLSPFLINELQSKCHRESCPLACCHVSPFMMFHWLGSGTMSIPFICPPSRGALSVSPSKSFLTFLLWVLGYHLSQGLIN
jgi:hypothetical protein